MRVRRQKKTIRKDVKPATETAEEIKTPLPQGEPLPESGLFRGPLRFMRKVLDNPNLGFQIMVIILTLASDNIKMERRIEGMTTTVDKIRNITDVLNNTMGSVKVASEAPRKIRQLLE